MKMIAALRNQFGGHAVTSAAGSTEKGADSPGADAVAPVAAEPDVSEGEVRGAPGTPPEADAGLRLPPRPVHVSHLSLVDFRSWAELELELGPGSTALVGAERPGQDQRVEAVGYAATPVSHRVAADAPAVRAGRRRAVVRAKVERDGRSTLVELEVNPGKANRARLQPGAGCRGHGEVLGRAAHGAVRAGGPRPGARRPVGAAAVPGRPAGRLARRATPACAPTTSGCSSSATPCSRPRSCAAARGARGADMRTLDVWDSHLAPRGAELLGARLALVDGAAAGGRARLPRGVRRPGRGGAGLPQLAGRGAGRRGARRRDREVLAAALLSELARVRPAGGRARDSLVGPHRDELALVLGGLPVKGYASHGESWSFALALRLASYALLRADGGEPVLVLDDVFAELDTGRRDRLATLVGGAEQVL
jgi:DNA replication and repair protein RecF